MPELEVNCRQIASLVFWRCHELFAGGSVGTDAEWEAWGRQDPYFGVLSHDQFHRHNLTAESLGQFFASGQEELAEIQADCIRYFGEVSMRRSLDFGCGVGRFLIPLAGVSSDCFGVDVSDAMRNEAAVNCARFGRANIDLAKTLEELPRDAHGFSFIHSYIVLQHIDTQRGMRIIASLMELLAKNGTAALHMTFAKQKYAYNLGMQPLHRRAFSDAGRRLSKLRRMISGGEPQMAMNPYNLNRVLFLFQRMGVETGGFRLTNHVGNLGVMFYVRRAR